MHHCSLKISHVNKWLVHYAFAQQEQLNTFSYMRFPGLQNNYGFVNSAANYIFRITYL